MRTRVLVALARLLLCRACKGVERVGNLVGQGSDIVFHGCDILLKALIGGSVGHVFHRFTNAHRTLQFSLRGKRAVCVEVPLFEPLTPEAIAALPRATDALSGSVRR